MNPVRRRLVVSVVLSVVFAATLQTRAWMDHASPVETETLGTPSLTIPPEALLPSLELGQHTGIINAIATDSTGQTLVTGSEDGTVRVWDMRTGGLRQTFYMPGGQENGAVYALALSPNGKTIACGGRTQYEGGGNTSVYLLDRTTGEIQGRIEGLEQFVGGLAFSPDGSRLAVGLLTGLRTSLGFKRDTNGGVRVFSLKANADHTFTSSLLWRDRTYAGDCSSMQFDPAAPLSEPRLLTAAYDGKVRLYNASGVQTAVYTAPVKARFEQTRFDDARFSPDGKRVAVGCENIPDVFLLSGSDLSYLGRARRSGTEKGNLSSVCYGHDGQTLYGAGTLFESAPRNKKKQWLVVRRWKKGGQGAFQDTRVAYNTIFDLAPLPNGDVAYVTAVPSVGVLKPNGAVRLQIKPATVPTMENGPANFRISRQGDVVSFPWPGDSRKVARFDVTARMFTLQPAVPADPSLSDPLTRAPGLLVTGWNGTRQVKRNGTLLRLDDPFASAYSLAIAPSRKYFVLGTTNGIEHFDADTHSKPFFGGSIPTPAEVWALNIAPQSGRVCIASLNDGTLRWYDLETGRELFALYLNPDGRRWVMWTKDGTYDASPGAENLFGFLRNRGSERLAEWKPAHLVKPPTPGYFADLLRAYNKTAVP